MNTLRELILDAGVYNPEKFTHIALLNVVGLGWMRLDNYKDGQIFELDYKYNLTDIITVNVRANVKLDPGTTWLDLIFGDEFTNEHRWLESYYVDEHPHDGRQMLVLKGVNAKVVLHERYERPELTPYFRDCKFLLGAEILVDYPDGQRRRYVHNIKYDYQLNAPYIVDNMGAEHWLNVPQYYVDEETLVDYRTYVRRLYGTILKL